MMKQVHDDGIGYREVRFSGARLDAAGHMVPRQRLS
jgi:hypothetical protein